jgi:hypothetical protein
MNNGAALAGLHLLAAEPRARELQAKLRAMLNDFNPSNATAVLTLAGLLMESFQSAPPVLRHVLAEGVAEMLGTFSAVR